MKGQRKNMGTLLIVVGIIIVLIGLLFYFSDNIPMIGKMPGDIRIERENFTFYFPVATSILLSVVISVVIYLIRRFS